MTSQSREKILHIFNQNHGYSTTGAIMEQGIHNSYLTELENEGLIKKIKRGLYILTDREPESGLVDASRLIPGGVICLTSALAFYDLTTVEPLSTDIAIAHKRKIVIPEYPPIHLVYFTKNRFETGISARTVEGRIIQVYDREKTLCDAVFYRHKIGIDIVKESLQNYIRAPGKNIQRLLSLAATLRVEKSIRNYLEVLL
jgi:predicted transcriptional regulator of viral defense system